MTVTKNLGGGSLIGVPIYYGNGENFGTLCGMDLRPHHFTEDHIDLFKAMANLLGNVLDLESANNKIQTLSVPFVPISDEVAILPIIGDVDEERTDRIMEITLSESVNHNLEYLILDLSGLISIDSNSTVNLLKIGNSLSLLGVKSILTGIRPELALRAIRENSDFENLTVKANLKQALSSIGYSIVKS
ncbi:STAS domain-containing protein [Alkalihalobacillus berkeleyi]|uniref:STAS domain-containing protein n=2 Tax=Pseudalkalibacillus berkeleyi TaxID=1069813 RepID=A0ABS9H3P3_9BACL|nr:STAS domain-containing protein [Pseudalkalibacillus berkeleyi]